jgi:hypothetical protein
MHHAFYALAAHVDIDKFELEDGVVRRASRELLLEESTISRVLVDIPTERPLSLDIETHVPEWDVSLIITAESSEQSAPHNFAELIIDVASVIGQRAVSTIEVSELSSSWIGSATPGPKISFLLNRSAGVDAGSYDGWLRDALNDCIAKVDDVGCRAFAPLRKNEVDAGFDTIASFWFPSVEALESAVGEHVFNPLLTSHLVDNDAIRAMSSVEHRLTPNPNTWSMPTGPLMPVAEEEGES